MEINWFVFIAQLFNFIVLVWLLQRFLYKPVVNAIAEREKKIADQLESARQQRAGAEKEMNDFRLKNELFDAQKKALMENVLDEANHEKERLLSLARSESESMREKLEASYLEFQEGMKTELAQRTQHEVLLLARRALASIAHQNLEHHVVAVFIEKVSSSRTRDMDYMFEAILATSAPVVVWSAFDLSNEYREEIKHAVNKLAGFDIQFLFEVKPELIVGIELTAHGYKLAWNVSEFLATFEQKLVTPVSIP